MIDPSDHGRMAVILATALAIPIAGAAAAF